MCRCDAIKQDLKLLTARQLAVLVFHHRDEMSYEKIAAVLNISVEEVMAAFATGLLTMTLTHKARKATP